MGYARGDGTCDGTDAKSVRKWYESGTAGRTSGLAYRKRYRARSSPAASARSTSLGWEGRTGSVGGPSDPTSIAWAAWTAWVAPPRLSLLMLFLLLLLLLLLLLMLFSARVGLFV
jgi:hypothetical protein